MTFLQKKKRIKKKEQLCFRISLLEALIRNIIGKMGLSDKFIEMLTNNILFGLSLLTGAQFENNNEVGVFAMLTNSYCLVAIGGSENFYR